MIVTPGEPAGVGPDICIKLSQKTLPYDWAIIADPDLIQQRANQLGVAVTLSEFCPDSPLEKNTPGELKIIPCKTSITVEAGQPDTKNAGYVLDTIELAVKLCQQDKHTAYVTGPVHKAIINQAGIEFSGHTEYIAQLTGAKQPVMMLQTPGLRVALVTTHLPLSRVSESITSDLLQRIITGLHADLIKMFNIAEPLILVCGLNPHAGEDGHLGSEEKEIISPVLEKLKHQGIKLIGPLSADTLFTSSHMDSADVVLAMYHDQGLPVLKFKGFGKAVNITLGLPIVRTSVDHGTALELAGTGRANSSSMEYAMQIAHDMLGNIRK